MLLSCDHWRRLVDLHIVNAARGSLGSWDAWEQANVARSTKASFVLADHELGAASQSETALSHLLTLTYLSLGLHLWHLVLRYFDIICDSFEIVIEVVTWPYRVKILHACPVIVRHLQMFIFGLHTRHLGKYHMTVDRC